MWSLFCAAWTAQFLKCSPASLFGGRTPGSLSISRKRVLLSERVEKTHSSGWLKILSGLEQ